MIIQIHGEHKTARSVYTMIANFSVTGIDWNLPKDNEYKFGFYPSKPLCVSTVYAVLSWVLCKKTQAYSGEIQNKIWNRVEFEPTTFAVL